MVYNVVVIYIFNKYNFDEDIFYIIKTVLLYCKTQICLQIHYTVYKPFITCLYAAYKC